MNDKSHFDVVSKVAGPTSAQPRTGTRFVVQTLTTLQPGHATPAQICRRIVDSYGGDQERAADEVDVIVGLNRQLSVGRPAASTLAQLLTACDEPVPLRSQLLTFGWSAGWRDKNGRAIDMKTVQAWVRRHPEHLDEMLKKEASLTPPMGALRSKVARYAQGIQQRQGNERVWTLITDADTIFPLGFFDALREAPENIRLISGGYSFGPAVGCGFTEVQNMLDMSIRRAVDPALPYYPEPALALDTSSLRDALDFGSSRFESRRLIDLLAAAQSPTEAPYLRPEQMLFSSDPRLCVQTDGARFVHKSGAPATFSDAMRQLSVHPQSHAGVFAWGHQLMATTGIPSGKLATLAQLYSVPHLMSLGHLQGETVRAHLDEVDAWMRQKLQSPAGPAHLFDAYIDVLSLHSSPALIWHVAKQMRLWADTTLQVIETQVLKDTQAWSFGLRHDHAHQLASASGSQAGDDPFLRRLLMAQTRGAASITSPHVSPPPRTPLLAHRLPDLDAALSASVGENFHDSSEASSCDSGLTSAHPHNLAASVVLTASPPTPDSPLGPEHSTTESSPQSSSSKRALEGELRSILEQEKDALMYTSRHSTAQKRKRDDAIAEIVEKRRIAALRFS